MQRFSVALGNVNACIAEHMGVAIGLQMFSPYRAGEVVRCSLLVVRESYVAHFVEHRVPLCNSVILAVDQFMRRLAC